MKNTVTFFILLVLCFFRSVNAELPLAEMSLKTAQEDSSKIAESIIECESIKSKKILPNVTIHCLSNAFYFESNSVSKSDSASGTVRISNYNFLHPGTSKTMFKDYAIVSKMLNHFDLVSANELLGLVGSDVSFNRNLMKFIDEGPSLLVKYQEELKKASSSRAQEINQKIKKLKSDIALAPKLYRIPGYIKILKELRSLDASWSLVISPRGDSTLLGSVEEYSGFFYRKSRINLSSNNYCVSSNKSTRNEACLITMRDEFSLKNSATFFSRRPMIAKFVVGNLKFSYLTSHVVFNSFEDEERMDQMLLAAFETKNLKNIGNGINEINYARWVEVSLIAKWMANFKRKYPQEKLIYGGDTNLISSLDVWGQVLRKYSADAALGNSDKTTLTTRRYNNKNEETHGLANDYDHFIFKPSEFSQCKVAPAYNFMKNSVGTALKNRYMIRDEANLLVEKSLYTPKIQKGSKEDSSVDGDIDQEPDDSDIELDYRLSAQNEKKMKALLEEYQEVLKTEYQIKNNELIIDDQKLQEKLEAYKIRVFIKQLTNLNFYKVYQEIISDHLPISMECSI